MATRMEEAAVPPVADEDDLLDLKVGPPLSTRGGEMARLTEDGRGFELTASDGALLMTVRFEGGQASLAFPTGRVRLSAPEEVEVATKRFAVRAEELVHIASGGDLEQVAGGNASLQAAKAVHVAAMSDNVEVDAPEGDVDIQGHRILLNS